MLKQLQSHRNLSLQKFILEMGLGGKKIPLGMGLKHPRLIKQLLRSNIRVPLEKTICLHFLCWTKGQ